MKRAAKILSGVVLTVFLFTAVFIVSTAMAQPGQGRPGHFYPPQSKFEVNRSLKDNLMMYQGREVVINLNSGKTLQGNVKAAGDKLVHLEKLSGGRDFSSPAGAEKSCQRRFYGYNGLKVSDTP